jgi:hypothetical protein
MSVSSRAAAPPGSHVLLVHVISLAILICSGSGPEDGRE